MIRIIERFDSFRNVWEIDTKLNPFFRATSKERAVEIAQAIMANDCMSFLEFLDISVSSGTQHPTIRTKNIICIQSEIEADEHT